MARPSRTGGKTSGAKARNASPAKGRKSTKTKPRIAPAARIKGRSVSDPSKDLKEAREQQAATAEILKVIASSPDDVQPVFQAIADQSKRLLKGLAGAVYTLVDDAVHLMSLTPVSPTADAHLKANFPVPLAEVPWAESARRGEIFWVIDAEEESVPRRTRDIARIRGWRSVLFVPLLSDKGPIGAISVARVDPGSFADHHVQLLQTFADQAVIAIQNAQSFNETKEALERQTATAEILKVIASSPSDVQPVFDAIVTNAVRLSGGFSAGVYRFVDDNVHLGAFTSINPVADETLRASFPRPIGDLAHFRTAQQTGKVFAIPDTEDQSDERLKDIASARGFRSLLHVPLKSGATSIGTVAISRKTPGPFSAHHVELLQTFADQAVIAIENVRLFNETREALERQTATADILKVIARSPSDTQPVFEAIATSANRLLAGYSTAVFRLFDGTVHLAAFTPTNPTADEALKADFPKPVDAFEPLQLTGPGEPFPIPDTEEIPYAPIREIARLHGFRSMLFIPLMNGGLPIGVISVTRAEPGAFAPHHVQLLQTFADQAVIAIENVRLFDETQEALERQTATADVLKVIASSPVDVQPVFEAIATSSNRLLGGFSCTVVRFIDGMAHLKAFTPTTPEADRVLQSGFPQPVGGFAPFQNAHAGEVTQVPDTEALVGRILNVSRARGFRSMLFAPLVNKGEAIGVIGVTRLQVGRFADHHVQLLKTFADQAVIAIENVRLFDEVQARTRDLSESLEHQTAISDILQVISSSPGNVQPVLATVAQHAAQICEAQIVDILTVKDDKLHYAAEFGDFGRILYGEAAPLNRETVMGRSVCDKQTVHVVDLQSMDHDFPLGREYALALGHRTTLAVPLIREDRAFGTILVRRAEVRPFDDRHITLLKTFADQAAIAIENARLFNEVQDRTADLSRSLDDLRAAQDRLIQTEKLASLGQLTAGIAHEIKNPLNFVNNFSALSAELTDELNDVLKPVTLDSKVRGEVDELTGMLKDNLEKVVQHGKRADSIVKNMLLHSREGSGEHRLADINAIVDESLNLAYHGARAEKPNFNVTMRRSFDPAVGNADIYPQEITRVLLNLISNGFYATAKRKTETGDDFEPTVTGTTKNLGENVEIRIRDNGTGIPDEVKVKIFNPFFTTKPAGEGTGLGLSMSHDIIVKQHGGKIDVETEPGQFTEFRIVLPRTNNFTNK